MSATVLKIKSGQLLLKIPEKKNFLFFHSDFPNGYISKMSALSSPQFETYSNFARMFSYMPFITIVSAN